MNLHISILLSLKAYICPIVPRPPPVNNVKLSLNFYQVFKDYALDSTNEFVLQQIHNCTPPWLVECPSSHRFINPSILIPLFPISDTQNLLEDRILYETLFNSRMHSKRNVNEFRHVLSSNIPLIYDSKAQISPSEYPTGVYNTLSRTYNSPSKSAFVIARPSGLLQPYLCIYKTLEYNDNISQFPPLIKEYMHIKHRDKQRNEELDPTTYLKQHCFHFDVSLKEIHDKCNKMVISPGIALLIPQILHENKLRISFSLMDSGGQNDIMSSNKYIYSVQINKLNSTGSLENITQLYEYACTLHKFEDTEVPKMFEGFDEPTNTQNAAPMSFFDNKNYNPHINRGERNEAPMDSTYDREFDELKTPITGQHGDGQPGSNGEGQSGGNNGSQPGGNDGSQPGGNDGGNPGNNDGANPGNNDGANPGNNDGSKPDSNDGSKPDSNDGSKPDSNDGDKPGGSSGPNSSGDKIKKIVIPCLVVIFVIIIIVIIVKLSKKSSKK